MEFTVTMGFPIWSSLTEPCLLCNAELVSLHNHSSFSLRRCSHALKTMATFSAACDRYEIWISIALIDMHQRIFDLLYYNRSKSSVKPAGRVLRDNIADLGLLKGDRLEPNPDMPNHSAFDMYTVFDPPKRVVFWRGSAEGPCRHRIATLSSTKIRESPTTLWYPYLTHVILRSMATVVHVVVLVVAS